MSGVDFVTHRFRRNGQSLLPEAMFPGQPFSLVTDLTTLRLL